MATHKDVHAHVYLVSDTRERYVHGLIEHLFSEVEKTSVGHTVSQINTGDYLICRRLRGGEPEILACIERKTLKDFAASFKDGRYQNRNKMMDLRDKTGCQLYFFVEGPAFPRPTWKVSRIPYGSILSAMTNLMIRDGIHVVQTENELGTAQRLLDFTRAFERVEVPYQYPTPRAGDPSVEGGGEGPRGQTAREQVGTGVPDMVMGTVEKSDSILAIEVWATLKGLSLSTAEIVAANFSVADLVCGRVQPADIEALRTAGGRQLVKQGRASLLGLLRGGAKEETRVLSGVPGVSAAMAAQILSATGGLSHLLSRDQAGIAATSIQQKGRSVRLGPARAERIFRLLNHRSGADNDPAPDEAAPLPDDPELYFDPEKIVTDEALDAILDDLFE